VTEMAHWLWEVSWYDGSCSWWLAAGLRRCLDYTVVTGMQ